MSLRLSINMAPKEGCSGVDFLSLLPAKTDQLAVEPDFLSVLVLFSALC